MEIINATDGYKLGHHRMYPEGTEQVYSNWTPRSNKYFPEATEGSVVFGIQYLIKEYLIKQVVGRRSIIAWKYAHSSSIHLD